jgi:starch phosphorylase
MTTPEVAARRTAGYVSRDIVESNPELQEVLEAIRSGLFSPDDAQRYQGIYDALVNWGDHYMLLADYASYLEAQERVDLAYQDPRAWTIKALKNVSAMGPFSADRTIAEYAENIWKSGRLEI